MFLLEIFCTTDIKFGLLNVYCIFETWSAKVLYILEQPMNIFNSTFCLLFFRSSDLSWKGFERRLFPYWQYRIPVPGRCTISAYLYQTGVRWHEHWATNTGELVGVTNVSSSVLRTCFKQTDSCLKHIIYVNFVPWRDLISISYYTLWSISRLDVEHN